MGFLMYVKHMWGGGKITPPQSKILKKDAKKLKLTPKLDYITRALQNKKKKFAPNTSFDDFNTFSA